MRIKILKTITACPDGFTHKEYQSGTEHQVSDEFGQMFLREGWAEDCDAKALDERENKNAGEAPENKFKKKK